MPALNCPLTFNSPALVLFLNSLIAASTLGLIFLRSLGILQMLLLRWFFK